MDIVFWYDVVCPYACIGAWRLSRLARQHGLRVDWRPVLLGGIYNTIHAPDSPAARARVTALDLLRQAERADFPLRINPRHPQRSVEAMRLLTAAPPDQRPALSLALYRHYHVEGGDLDRQALTPIAEAHGLTIDLIDEPRVQQALREETQAAVDHGAFGVPSMWALDRLYFGNDRLDLLLADLGLPPDPPAIHLGPRVAPPRLTFFHDLASPFSYLASRQVPALAEATGAELTWAPVLVGALFTAVGTPQVPMAEFPAQKRAWFAQDLQDQARRIGVGFTWPAAFPLRTVTPLRVCLVQPAATACLYEAAWVHDLDIGDRPVLGRVLDAAGFDGAALIAATEQPSIKERLKANTAEAQRLGACGVPTFLVDDRYLFWGQDRLDHVRDALLGWQPAA